MTFGVIDYGMGNLLSVRNALVAVGAEVRVLVSGHESADAYILPGVGAFHNGMAGLHERGFTERLDRDVREGGRPILGICLGLQLFAETGFEQGECPGLGWIGGEVRRIETPHRVPHIGWNDVSGSGPLFTGIPPGASFYFVHSFHLVPTDPAVVTGRTGYGPEMVAAVHRGNIHGVQFHPEKSHKHGLALLANFVKLAC